MLIVDVTAGMTLSQVITRIRDANGDSVTIRISENSSLLLTANEFRALSLAAEREQIPIAVESSDPLRRQLAALFGVPLSVPIELEENLKPTLDDVLPFSATGETEPADGREGAEPAKVSVEPAADEDSNSHGISKSRTDPAPQKVADWKKSYRRRLLKPLAWLASIAAVAAITTLGYWYFLGEATIRMELVSVPVSATVPFSVVADPNSMDETREQAVTAEAVTFQLNVSLQIPASGAMTVGDQAATGEVVLRNASEVDVSIGPSTVITTFEGNQYQFVEPIVVPAATPDGRAGEMVAVISAATPGGESNRELGMLSGQLQEGVYFSNRTTPVSGGTDRLITVVTEEDLAKLQVDAERTLASLAMSSTLAGNLRIVPSTLSATVVQNRFDHQPGDEAADVKVESTVTYEALAFSTDELTDIAIAALGSSVPEDYELRPGTLTFDPPVESGESNGLRSMIVSVHGEAVASVSTGQMDDLADELSGKGEREAVEILNAQPWIRESSVTFRPSWLPKRIPTERSRIEFISP
ncbi:hypothetical protein BH23CHL5_BH23CHL5_05580 [soil metagenome]